MKTVDYFVNLDYGTVVMLNRCIEWFTNKFGFEPTRNQMIQFILTQVELKYDATVEKELLRVQQIVSEFPDTKIKIKLLPQTDKKLLDIFINAPHPDINLSGIVTFFILVFYRQFVQSQ